MLNDNQKQEVDSLLKERTVFIDNLGYNQNKVQELERLFSCEKDWHMRRDLSLRIKVGERRVAAGKQRIKDLSLDCIAKKIHVSVRTLMYYFSGERLKSGTQGLKYEQVLKIENAIIRSRARDCVSGI